MKISTKNWITDLDCRVILKDYFGGTIQRVVGRARDRVKKMGFISEGAGVSHPCAQADNKVDTY